MRPTLIHMHTAMLIDDPVVSWPELGKVEELDVQEEFKTYFEHGCPVWNDHEPKVVSLPEGSEMCLRMLEEEIDGDNVLCISVRRMPGLHAGWLSQLGQLASKHNIGVAYHERHDVLEVIGHRQFRDAFLALERCADIVRGEGIEPSNEAMRTEKALSRAIDILRATGFRAPRKR